MRGALNLVVVSTISLIAAATASSAQTVKAQGVDIVVKVGDLNLSSPQDAKAFEERLDVAAHELCRQISFIGTRLPKFYACREDVRAEAKEALDGGMPQFVAVARSAARPDGF